MAYLFGLPSNADVDIADHANSLMVFIGGVFHWMFIGPSYVLGWAYLGAKSATRTLWLVVASLVAAREGSQ